MKAFERPLKKNVKLKFEEQRKIIMTENILPVVLRESFSYGKKGST